MDKLIVIIAGPNGAGKTTFAEQYLPEEAGIDVFINADLIASGLSPFNPEAQAVHAGKLMLQEISSRVQSGDSFGFETTMSGKNYARMIPLWKRSGYRIQIVFLSLPSPDMAVARVKSRVMNGGHNIPEETIRRRFESGLANFNSLYKPLADEWILYDNSDVVPIILKRGENL